MLSPVTDLAPAQWLAVAGTDFRGAVADLVPTGYERYVRIFHRPDQGRPSPGCAARWAQVAARHGTVLHPEAQWVPLTGGREDSPHRLDDPSSPSDQPLVGSLDPLILARLAEHLARHTATPQRCHTAVWHGTGKAPLSWRGFSVFHRPHRGYWLFAPVPTQQVPALSVEFEVLDLEEEARSRGGLSGLAVFGRELAREDGLRWARETTARGFVQSPSYWWPEDRSWVVHSEVDYDSTLLAGGAALAQALLADPDIECLGVDRRTSLFANADRINGD